MGGKGRELFKYLGQEQTKPDKKIMDQTRQLLIANFTINCCANPSIESPLYHIHWMFIDWRCNKQSCFLLSEHPSLVQNIKQFSPLLLKWQLRLTDNWNWRFFYGFHRCREEKCESQKYNVLGNMHWQMCKSGCTVVILCSTLICLRLYDVVPLKYSASHSMSHSVSHSVSHWSHCCHTGCSCVRSKVTSQETAARSHQKGKSHKKLEITPPPVTEIQQVNWTEIKRKSQKSIRSFFWQVTLRHIVSWEHPLITDVFTKALITSSETGRTNVKHHLE